MKRRPTRPSLDAVLTYAPRPASAAALAPPAPVPGQPGRPDDRADALTRRLISSTTISRVGGPLAIPDPVCPKARGGASCGCHWCLRRLHGHDYSLTMPHPTAPPKGRR